MSFVVSARKYRPQRFDEVVGQEHVSRTLKNALQTDHVAHAFLFCGPRGVGKTTCARILAKVLNCEQATDDMEPCNTCPSCQSFNSNSSFNIYELDAASNNSVDHIRNLVDQVRFPPQQGKYKVYIIDEVHMLSQSAFNAFLKTLEEPPPYAIFILATTEKHKIIPTILSRCQVFDFRRILVPDIVTHLETICREEGISGDQDALHIIAQKSEGALRDALSIFDRIVSYSEKQISYQDVVENLNLLDYDHYFRIVDLILQEDMAGVLRAFNEILQKGFEPETFINGLAEHLRNLLVSKDPEVIDLIEVGEKIKARYKAQGKICGSSFLLTALNMINECDINFKTAKNKKLHSEVAIIKLCYIGKAIQAHTMGFLPTDQSEKKTNEPALIEKKPRAVEKKREAKPDHLAKPSKNKAEPTEKSEISQEIPANSPKNKAEPAEKSEISKNSPPQDPKEQNEVKMVPDMSLGSLEQFEAEVEADVEEEDINDFLTQDHVEKKWKEYTANLSSKAEKASFKKAKVLIEGTQINARVNNSTCAERIRKDGDLLDFLRSSLKNRTILLSVEVDKAIKKDKVTVDKPLTDKEKYQKLLEQNPTLSELQKRLDLRLDK